MRAYELFDLDVNEVKRCKISFTKKIIKVKVARVVVFEKYKKLRISYFFELEMLDQSHWDREVEIGYSKRCINVVSDGNR